MRIRVVSLAITLLFARSLFAAVGFQEATVPDPQGDAIAVGIWYPSSGQPSPLPLGMFSQTVAANSEVSGENLPLVLISHGTGGSLASHYDTAIALAEAGFVVAALTHTGDNYADQSYVGNRKDLIDRPRQVKVVLDWILSSWTGHSSLNAGRVGIFGFSLGGFTSLVEIGGTPELARMAQLCSIYPSAPECAFVAKSHGDQLAPNATEPTWVHDKRIKAAVVAAPAVGFLFGPGDLRQVTIPVQLWRAGNDTQAPDQWNSGIIRKDLPRHPEDQLVPGADHFVFLAPCSDALRAAAPEICQDAPGFDRAAFHRAFNKAVVRFFNGELKDR
jgi:predicted dienelactone hydrolase